MDSATLVGASVQDGKRLIAELDTEKFDVSSALWFHDVDEGRWKLIIASKEAARRDIRDAYKKVRRVIRNNPGISVNFDDIVITRPDDDLIRLLRHAIRTGPGIDEIRFSRNVIKNVLIDDAIIYRIQ